MWTVPLLPSPPLISTYRHSRLDERMMIRRDSCDCLKEGLAFLSNAQHTRAWRVAADFFLPVPKIPKYFFYFHIRGSFEVSLCAAWRDYLFPKQGHSNGSPKISLRRVQFRIFSTAVGRPTPMRSCDVNQGRSKDSTDRSFKRLVPDFCYPSMNRIQR